MRAASRICGTGNRGGVRRTGNEAEFKKVTAFKILDKEFISDDEVLLTVMASGINESGRFKLQRVGNEWKFAGPAKAVNATAAK